MPDHARSFVSDLLAEEGVLLVTREGLLNAMIEAENNDAFGVDYTPESGSAAVWEQLRVKP